MQALLEKQHFKVKLITLIFFSCCSVTLSCRSCGVTSHALHFGRVRALFAEEGLKVTETAMKS